MIPVNPDLIARRRGPARKKDDPEDARIACLLALDPHAGLTPVVPHGALAAELRSIARDDERAARDQTRLLNRPRADLTSVVPAALVVADAALARRPCCACWSATPAPNCCNNATGKTWPWPGRASIASPPALPTR